MMKKTVLPFLLLLFSVVGCSYNDQDFQDELTKKSTVILSTKDLLGAWQMYDQNVDTKLMDETSFFYKYQAWLFLKDGHVKIMSLKDKSDPEEIALFFNTAPKNIRYSLDKKGMITVKSPEREDLLFDVRVITQDLKNKARRWGPDVKKGDLLFLYSKPAEEPYMKRFVRRVELPEIQSEDAFSVPQSSSYDKETGNVYF